MATGIQFPLRHGDFRLERVFNAPPARVFAAWATAEMKAQWFKGPGTWELLERRLEFRVGGQEVLRGRFGDGLETLYTATFHAISPNQGLVFTYDMHHAGSHLSVSVASVEFTPDKAGTRMTFTEQAVYFDGQDGTESRKTGTAAHFERLAAVLQGN